jgi:1-deoxy-D-xylulose-5-phosphate synthase
LVAEATDNGPVFTLEENVLEGGFGSAVLEMLCDAGVHVPVTRIGLPDKFVEQGSQSELRSRYGIDAAGVVKVIMKALKP